VVAAVAAVWWPWPCHGCCSHDMVTVAAAWLLQPWHGGCGVAVAVVPWLALMSYLCGAGAVLVEKLLVLFSCAVPLSLALYWCHCFSVVGNVYVSTGTIVFVLLVLSSFFSW